MHVLMSVRTCMKNLNQSPHRVEHSPVAAPATTWVKQNVIPCLGGSTVCEYFFQYDKNLHVKNKSKCRLFCLLKGSPIFRILLSIYFNVNVAFSFFLLWQKYSAVCPVACLTESFLTSVLYKLLLDFINHENGRNKYLRNVFKHFPINMLHIPEHLNLISLKRINFG